MRSSLIVAIVVILAGSGLLIVTSQDRGEASMNEPTNLNTSEFVQPSDEVRYLDDGTKYTVHPDEIEQGCPGFDCIQSIDDPSFVSAGDADSWLEDDERIIGLEYKGTERAYPLRILAHHEIVNDRINGDPVLITYCPLCRSGLAFERSLNGTTFEFGVSGKLLNANLVMYDRETETLWSQIQGEAIVGELVPAELELIHSSVTTWKAWYDGHPETDVLSRDTGMEPIGSYDVRPYAGYEDQERVGFGVGTVDDRLHPKHIVHGVRTGRGAKAYPADTIRETAFIQDTINGTPILIFEHTLDGSIVAFNREVDGRTRDLAVSNETIRAGNGDTWSLSGEAEGDHASLEQYSPRGFFWFAWVKFNPDTAIYQPE